MTHLRAWFASVRFYQAVSGILLAGLVWLGQDEMRDWISDHYPLAGNAVVEPLAPYAKEVRRIIAPLKYSALEHFMDPATKLMMDPSQGVWGLSDLHLFDDQGRIQLRQGRYGICGDLAAYTFERVRRLFPKERFSISFLQVAESSFFNLEGGTHIILEIVDHESLPEPKTYYLDPSLRKYGSRDLFGGYLPKQRWGSLDFVVKRMSDQYFPLESGPPVHMNHNVLISLYVMANDGKFDENNYVVMLSGLKRYDYVNRPLVVCVNDGGRRSITEFDTNIAGYMTRGKYAELKARVLRLCAGITFVRNAPASDLLANTEASNMYALSRVDPQNMSLLKRAQ